MSLRASPRTIAMTRREFAEWTLRSFSPISAVTRVFDALWGRRTG